MERSRNTKFQKKALKTIYKSGITTFECSRAHITSISFSALRQNKIANDEKSFSMKNHYDITCPGTSFGP